MTQNLRVPSYVASSESRNPDGRPSSWQSGPTRTIRVPIVLAEQVTEYARSLDRSESQVLTQNLSLSRVDEAVAILEQALTMRANAGGAIKSQIREALELLREK